MGDFNCALNCDVDRSSKKSNNNDKCAEIVNQYMENTYMRGQESPGQKVYFLH